MSSHIPLGLTRLGTSEQASAWERFEGREDGIVALSHPRRLSASGLTISLPLGSFSLIFSSNYLVLPCLLP